MLEKKDRNEIADVLSQLPEKIVLSNLTDKTHLYRKTVIHKMEMRGRSMYQVERFTQKQAFHENVELSDLTDRILDLFPDVYSQLNVFGAQRQWDFKYTKKGKLLQSTHEMKGEAVRRKNEQRITVEGEQITHNRKKYYLLKEGEVIPPLVDLGIFTKDGKIVRTMYDKYRQINRFLEIVEDVIKDRPDETLHIIDFGCGKSYLTFILYYYLVEVKGCEVEMTGLDLKADVIAKCNETARKYHYDHLRFELGDINGYKTDKPVDMVITLHACDTATDYALYNAISWNAGIILSVPCCQKEVNAQIQSESLPILTKYGIVKERFSALMTDAVRANMLEYCGYRTQLMEFVDFASSPKNILIRAVKGNVSKEKRQRAKKEVDAILSEFHVEQTLVKLLTEDHE